MNNIEILEINYNTLKTDLENQSVDLFVAKIEAETQIKKLNSIQQSEPNNKNVATLKEKVERLLDIINHELSIQAKEEYFNSSNQDI